MSAEDDLGNIIGNALMNYIDQAIQVYIGTLMASQTPPTPPAPPPPPAPVPAPPAPAPIPIPDPLPLSLLINQVTDLTTQIVLAVRPGSAAVAVNQTAAQTTQSASALNVTLATTLSIAVNQTGSTTTQNTVAAHPGVAAISVAQANAKTTQSTQVKLIGALAVTQTAAQTTQNTQAAGQLPAAASISVNQTFAKTTQNAQTQVAPPVAASYPRYFPANAVTVAPGGNVQAAIDANPAVILQAGSYSAVTGRTGKTIVGLPGKTTIDITIEAGANNFRFSGMVVSWGHGALFATGAKTFNGKLDHIKGPVYGPNANLEDITIWSDFEGQIDFTGTTMTRVHMIRAQSHNGGYIGPNNRFDIHMTGTGVDNIIVAKNSLEALNGSIYAKSQTRLLVFGQDEETYGKWITDGLPARTEPSVRFEDSVALLMGSGGAVHQGMNALEGLGTSTIIAERCGMSVDSPGKQYVQTGSSITKYAVQSSGYATAMGVTNLSTRPAFSFPPLPVIPPAIPELPLYLASNIGTDSYPTLQAMLDAGTKRIPINGILKLSQSLKVKSDDTYFIGNGMDVSALVCAGNFPAIMTQYGNSGSGATFAGFDMFDFSIHGGSVGVDLSEYAVQFNGTVWAGIAFVGQSVAGIRVIPPTFAIDNSSMEKMLFQDCNTGIYEIGDPAATHGGDVTFSYIDKLTMKDSTFYRCIPLNLQPARANNLICLLNNRSINCPAPQFGSHHNYLALFNNAWSTAPITSGTNNTIQYP